MNGTIDLAGLCPICKNRAEHIPHAFFPRWRCVRCGEFDYDASIGWREIKTDDEMVQLSGWVREQNAAGVVPARITLQSSLPALRERSERLLAALAKRYPRTGLLFVRNTEKHDAELQAISYSRNGDEIDFLLDILIDDGCINGRRTLAHAGLTTRGLLAAEALGASGSSSPQGFVAMWFDDSMNDAWLTGFEPAIGSAGYQPLRIDTKDYIGGVSDEIMAEIRRSRFVVADYTGQRNGVYFEAGFGAGLGLPIIPTCRADEIGRLHFDIRHLNTLVWKTPAELADTLAIRIRAVVGAGPDAAD